MTTVGYGDIFPVSPLGRVTGVIIALWGGLLTSLMIVTVERILEMSSPEERSINLIDRLVQKEILRESAGKVLYNSFKIRKSNEKNIYSRKKKFRAAMLAFRKVSRPIIYDQISAITDADLNLKEVRSVRRDIYQVRGMLKGILHNCHIKEEKEEPLQRRQTIHFKDL